MVGAAIRGLIVRLFDQLDSPQIIFEPTHPHKVFGYYFQGMFFKGVKKRCLGVYADIIDPN